MVQLVTATTREVETRNQMTPINDDDLGARLPDSVNVERSVQKKQKLKMKLLSERKAKEAFFGMFFFMLGLFFALFVFVILKCHGC